MLPAPQMTEQEKKKGKERLKVNFKIIKALGPSGAKCKVMYITWQTELAFLSRRIVKRKQLLEEAQLISADSKTIESRQKDLNQTKEEYLKEYQSGAKQILSEVSKIKEALKAAHK